MSIWVVLQGDERWYSSPLEIHKRDFKNLVSVWQSKESVQLTLPSSHLSWLSLLQHSRFEIIPSQWREVQKELMAAAAMGDVTLIMAAH